jgi:hypothetical protein
MRERRDSGTRRKGIACLCTGFPSRCWPEAVREATTAVAIVAWSDSNGRAKAHAAGRSSVTTRLHIREQLDTARCNVICTAEDCDSVPGSKAAGS